MKKIFTLTLITLSLSSYATKFEGRVEESEYGIERCDIDVKKLGRGKLELRVFAMGEAFKVIIREDTEDFSINTKSLQIPKSDISGKGVFDEGRPVSLQVTAKQKLEDQVFEDTINCKF